MNPEGGKRVIRIAIVEDDKVYQEQLTGYLHQYEQESGERFLITLFTDGDEITENYGSNFDIILMDIQMPFMDGMTAAECIRGKDSEVVIIFITSMPQFVMRGYTVDALDYVLKPISYFAFSQRIERALARMEKRKKKLSVDYLDEKIDAKIYTELNQGVDDDIRKLNGQIKGVQTALRTNLTPKLDYTISLINNVEQYFEDAPIEVKQRLLSLIFPEKVEFDGKSFRTKKINAVFELIDNETRQLRGTKKDKPTDLSCSVAGEGFEPTTSGL